MLQIQNYFMDCQETWNVYVILHSHEPIGFSEMLVCKILYGCYLKNCKIQILAKTNDTGIVKNVSYWYSENLHFTC